MKPFDHIDWAALARDELQQGNLSSCLGAVHQHFANYHQLSDPSPFELAWLEKMQTQVEAQPGESVLDIGGGQGALAQLLSARGAQVTVLEPSSACLPSLQALGLDVIGSEWMALEPVGSFDHVVCCRALGVACLVQESEIELLEGLSKMLAAARKTLTIIMRNYRFFPSLEAELRGLDQSGFARTPYLYPIPILFQLGYTPDLKWFEWREQVSYQDIDTLLDAEISVEGQEPGAGQELKQLKDYLRAVANLDPESGKYSIWRHWKNFVVVCRRHT